MENSTRVIQQLKNKTLATALAASSMLASFNSLANITSEIQNDHKGRSGILKIVSPEDGDYITVHCLENDEIVVGYTPEKMQSRSPHFSMSKLVHIDFAETRTRGLTHFISINSSDSLFYVELMLNNRFVHSALKMETKPAPYKRNFFLVRDFANHLKSACEWHPDFEMMMSLEGR